MQVLTVFGNPKQRSRFVKNSLFLVAASAASLVASTLNAQDAWKPDTRIGDFRFMMPVSWKRVDLRGGAQLVPSDLDGNSKAFIGFLAPQELHGDLRTWFDAQWADFGRQFKIVDQGTPTAGKTSQGLDYLRIYTRISSPSLGFGSFVFGAVQVGSRVEAYFFFSNANRYSYLNDLAALEQSLEFANGSADTIGETAVTDQGTAGGLDGLYLGYRMRGATAFESTHFEYLVFFPDGNAIRNLPFEGLEHFDFAAAVKTSREYCGRYRLNGDTVTITWGDRSEETGLRSASGLKIRGDSYFPVSKSDGLTLDGIYRREGADLARYGIRFTTAGRFEENGMLPLIAYALTTDKQINQAPGSGTYRIGNNTLTLQYADGRTIALSFFVWPAEPGPRPQAIHVETFRLIRDR